jgi:hypothetical protein
MLCAKLPRHIGAARVRVKPINFQTETLPEIRKKAVFGHQSADNFSELSLMEKTLPLLFSAAIWIDRSWSTVLALAYPTLAMMVLIGALRLTVSLGSGPLQASVS